MLLEDQAKFPAQKVTLKDGRDVILRFLSTQDADKLGDFYASIEHDAWRFYCPPRLTREDAQNKAAKATNATSVVLVAENEAQQIVGYNWYRWQENGKSSVFGICIHKDYRGLRLGRALMRRLIDMAAYVGPDVMSLTVQLANPRACALYRQMGFEVIREQVRGQIGDFPPEPEYYMERKV